MIHRKTKFWYLIVLAGAGMLYLLTCAPGVLWQDSGLYVYRIWHNDIQGNLGLALAHPLYFMIGIAVKYIPFGDLAWRINLISAVCGAVTIANLFLLLRLWLNRLIPALIGAVTLAVSWTFWQHAVIAETDTLLTALLFAELIMLLRYMQTKQIRYLYLLGFLNGLSIATCMWGMFGFVFYSVLLVILLVRKQIDLKHLCIILLFWVIGALPYEYLIIKDIILYGDVGATFASATFGNLFKNQVLNTSISMKIVFENIIFILLNFPTPNLVFFFVGLWALWKRSPNRGFANIIFALLVSFFLFAFRYTIPLRHAFFLPCYCLVSVLIALGADAVMRRYNHRTLVIAVLVFALLPIPTYCVAPDLARKVYKPLGQRRQRPYRDEYDYFLKPWKTGYRGAERFAREALDMVEENAIIYAYTTEVHALLYLQQVKGKRNDVKIVSDYDMSENAPVFNEDTIARLMKTSVVYVTTTEKGYCPNFLLQQYDFVQAGVLWKVVELE